MRRSFTRRVAIASGLAAAASCAPAPGSRPIEPHDDRVLHFAEELEQIEQRAGGRIGVVALNSSNGLTLRYRADQRFAMCSTFKWLLAAAVLYRGQSGDVTGDQHITYAAANLPPNSPRTRENLSRGWMSVDELCAAAVEVSDNGAANLLLARLGGPAGLTAFLRSNGDAATRLDRLEPVVNDIEPGDERDTTTPRAMAQTLHRFLVADSVLNETSREKLIGWMIAASTGLTRLRAGLPPTWRVGDKTGTSDGDHNATNDVAIAWPPGRAPIVIASYLSDTQLPYEQRSGVHAEIARTIAATWS